MESVFSQLFQHLHWIFKSVLGKLIVALPVGAKPSRVKVDYIGRYAVLSQLAGYLQSLLLREVGYATHPCTKAPQWGQWRLACNLCVFIQYVLWLAEEYKEVHLLIGHKQSVGSDV